MSQVRLEQECKSNVHIGGRTYREVCGPWTTSFRKENGRVSGNRERRKMGRIK